MSTRTNKQYSDLRLMVRLSRQARRYWLQVFVILLLNLLSTPLTLLTPVPVAIAVDSVVGGKGLPGPLGQMFRQGSLSAGVTLALAAGLVVVVALLAGLVSLAGSILRTYAGENMVLDFRARLFRHAQDLPLAYHDTHGTSDAIYHITWDAAGIGDIVIEAMPSFISAAVTLVSMFVVIFRIDRQLALIAVAVAPGLYVVGDLYRRRVRREWYEVKEMDRSALSVVQEALGAVRVVKAFGQETREQIRYVQHANAGLRARVRASVTIYGFSLVVGVISAVGMAVVLFVGVSHVLSGVLTLGSVIIVMAYLGGLYGPLETMAKKFGDMQASLAGAERAFRLLDEAPDVVERPDALPLLRAKGAVAFHHVSFGYDSDHEVLHDVSFDIAAGTRVGIAGTTGAGKTTLMSLLARFYDPTEGEILLDGLDLRHYKVADVRSQFAIVLQEPVLFSTSIAENIAYARSGATESEIVRAAQSANAHDFITRLPEGYGTLVGERGMKLSGGERQRIALARAFLKDAPVLILDEPTSSVDIGTEAKIVEAMERLMHRRTTFMIAHRLSTLEGCDLLLVIDDGRLVDRRWDVASAVRHAVKVG